MTSRRDEMLAEMGLTPVWRLRAPRAGTAPFDSGSAQAQDTSAAAEPTSSAGMLPATPALQDAVAAVETPAVPSADRRADIMRMEWPELKDAVAQCRECPLHAKRNKTVFGVGDENADWMFVGEGPGADEDALGVPFVGQAGKLLDNMLAAIELKRGQNVFIANVVKCRPPGNRNP